MHTNLAKLKKNLEKFLTAALEEKQQESKLKILLLFAVTESFSSGIGSDDVGQKIQNTIDQINTYV